MAEEHTNSRISRKVNKTIRKKLLWKLHFWRKMDCVKTRGSTITCLSVTVSQSIRKKPCIEVNNIS